MSGCTRWLPVVYLRILRELRIRRIASGMSINDRRKVMHVRSKLSKSRILTNHICPIDVLLAPRLPIRCSQSHIATMSPVSRDGRSSICIIHGTIILYQPYLCGVCHSTHSAYTLVTHSSNRPHLTSRHSLDRYPAIIHSISCAARSSIS